MAADGMARLPWSVRLSSSFRRPTASGSELGGRRCRGKLQTNAHRVEHTNEVLHRRCVTIIGRLGLKNLQ